MKALLAFLFLLQLGATSPFDGTWIIDSPATQPPQKPVTFLLAKGRFGLAAQQIKADGSDHKVPKTGYRDTVSVRIVDDRTVEVISKKAGKTMFTEVDTVSPDGEMLTQIVKDTTEVQAVTIETTSKRLEKGPDGSHALSGSTWGRVRLYLAIWLFLALTSSITRAQRQPTGSGGSQLVPEPAIGTPACT